MPNTALLDEKTPRYLAVIHDMRIQIRDGALRPGDRLPSISELRVAYGISKGTVERAQLVLEQEGLIVREHGRGIFVSPHLGRHGAARKGIVGVYGLAESFSANPTFWSYWSQVLSGVREVLQPRKTHVLLVEPETLGLEEQADGALLNGEYVLPQRQWLQEGWPCVSLLDPKRGEVDSVIGDVTQGVFDAVSYLVEQGHCRIAYLHNVSDTGARRLAGYRKGMKAHGLGGHPEWVRNFVGPDLVFQEFGHDAMRGWFKDGWQDLGCTALIAHNDAVAFGVMEAFTEAGIRVPQDVSLVGIDGTEMCDLMRPRLTSVQLPLREIGKRGAELLLAQMENKASGISRDPQHIVLPTCLRVRDSAAPPAGHL